MGIERRLGGKVVVFRAAALVPVKGSGRGAETGGERAGNETLRGHSPKVTQRHLPVRWDSTAPPVVAGVVAAPACSGAPCGTVKEHPGVPWRGEMEQQPNSLLASVLSGLFVVHYSSYSKQGAATRPQPRDRRDLHLPHNTSLHQPTPRFVRMTTHRLLSS